jgi:hypothetical protein
MVGERLVPPDAAKTRMHGAAVRRKAGAVAANLTTKTTFHCPTSLFLLRHPHPTVGVRCDFIRKKRDKEAKPVDPPILRPTKKGLCSILRSKALGLSTRDLRKRVAGDAKGKRHTSS